MLYNLDFYNGKRVLVTGHNGFKGTWLCEILKLSGANVMGYSLKPPTIPCLYDMTGLSNEISSIFGDIRDLDKLKKLFEEFRPEIVFHLAAQPIVIEGYRNPIETFETNIMGTVNILECVRQIQSAKSVVNVTTDKVYKNNEWCWGYRENEPLDGFDPYSNSKSCSELVTHSYNNSFFSHEDISVSTARAGNVIGGGDFAKNRIIPDCVRAVIERKAIKVRNPNSIRPYQHVLEPLMAYLKIGEMQYKDKKYQGYYNIGPDECDCISTGKLVELFCEFWGDGVSWSHYNNTDVPHESNFLKLDCSKIKSILGWKPIWHVDESVRKVCRFSKAWLSGENITNEMDKEIEEYLRDAKNDRMEK